MREFSEPQSGANGYVGHSLTLDRRAEERNEVPMGQAEFVAWVRSEMDRRGISQRVVAKRAGINHSGLSRLLRGGGGTMRFATAVALAHALGGRLAVDRSHETSGRCASCGHREPLYLMPLADTRLDARTTNIPLCLCRRENAFPAEPSIGALAVVSEDVVDK